MVNSTKINELDTKFSAPLPGLEREIFHEHLSTSRGTYVAARGTVGTRNN